MGSSPLTLLDYDSKELGKSTSKSENLRLSEGLTPVAEEHATHKRVPSDDIKPMSAWRQHLEHTGLDKHVITARKVPKFSGDGSHDKIVRGKTSTQNF